MGLDQDHDGPAARPGLIMLVTVLLLAAAGGIVWYEMRPDAVEHPYDLGGADKVDPALLRWNEAAVWPLAGAGEAVGLAPLADGGVLVARGRQLLRLSGDGAALGQTELGAPASCVAVAGDGRILVGLGAQIAVLSPSLVETVRWPALDARSWISAIAIGPGGAVAAADAGTACVWQIDAASGRAVGQFALRSETKGIPGLRLPERSFDATWGAEALWVVNPGLLRLEGYAPNGDLLRTVGRSGTDVGAFTGCHNPVAVALLGDGFVTAEKGICSIKEWSATGDLRAVVAPAASFSADQRDLVDLAVDGRGRVLALDAVRNAVRVYVRR